MKKLLIIVLITISFTLDSSAQKAGNFSGLDMNMGNLFRLSNAETRSISPENLTGEKGKGGMATLKEGVHGKQPQQSDISSVVYWYQTEPMRLSLNCRPRTAWK